MARRRLAVFLTAQSAQGEVLEEKTVPYDVFYDTLDPLIDSDNYRAEHGIRRLRGEIYNASGALQQSFENTYAEDGRYLSSRMVFEDGTVVED